MPFSLFYDQTGRYGSWRRLSNSACGVEAEGEDSEPMNPEPVNLLTFPSIYKLLQASGHATQLIGYHVKLLQGLLSLVKGLAGGAGIDWPI